MFEKEAEEYIKEHTFFDEEFGAPSLDVGSKTIFKDGAEFGYNKANEWHDVRHAQTEEEFPPENKDKLYVWKVDCRKYEKEKSDIKYHIGTQDDLMYEVYAYRVIAWKEIVLPELKEG